RSCIRLALCAAVAGMVGCSRWGTSTRCRAWRPRTRTRAVLTANPWSPWVLVTRTMTGTLPLEWNRWLAETVTTPGLVSVIVPGVGVGGPPKPITAEKSAGFRLVSETVKEATVPLKARLSAGVRVTAVTFGSAVAVGVDVGVEGDVGEGLGLGVGV